MAFWFSLVHLCTFYRGYFGVKAVLLRSSTVCYIYNIYILHGVYNLGRLLNRVSMRPTERSISSRTTPNKEHKHPQDKLFRFENSRITLSSSPRLGNRRASIPTEHRRVPTDHIGKMLRLLSQHVQTSNILTNLAVNGDCYDEVDLPLCR